jgi:uncharacterized lipoprotein YajG
VANDIPAGRLIIVGLLLLAGCSRGPVIDGSSPETFAKSKAAVMASVPVDQRTQFEEDLLLVSSHRMQKLKVQPQYSLQGLTAQQIQDEAQKIRAER